LGYYVRKPSPFFLAPRAQKEPKTPLEKFRLCGGDKGSALDLRAFEKARSKLFMSGRPYGDGCPLTVCLFHAIIIMKYYANFAKG
jgi:hypothetical protein